MTVKYLFMMLLKSNRSFRFLGVLGYRPQIMLLLMVLQFTSQHSVKHTLLWIRKTNQKIAFAMFRNIPLHLVHFGKFQTLISIQEISPQETSY